jgi:hypothetical protein
VKTRYLGVVAGGWLLALADIIKSDISLWAKVVRDAGIPAD